MDHVDFERGVALIPIRPAPPRLLETIEGHNIVFYDRKYVVIPQSAGPLDLEAGDYKNISGLLERETLQEARVAARCA